MDPRYVLFFGVVFISVAGMFITLARPQFVKHPNLAFGLTLLAVTVWLVTWGLLIRWAVRPAQRMHYR